MAVTIGLNLPRYKKGFWPGVNYMREHLSNHWVKLFPKFTLRDPSNLKNRRISFPDRNGSLVFYCLFSYPGDMKETSSLKKEDFSNIHWEAQMIHCELISVDCVGTYSYMQVKDSSVETYVNVGFRVHKEYLFRLHPQYRLNPEYNLKLKYGRDNNVGH